MEKNLITATLNYVQTKQEWNQLALTQNYLHLTRRMFDCIVTVELTM